MNDPLFRDGMPLYLARANLKTIIDEGRHCPCCGQFAKVYRRTINSGIARSLIVLYKAAGCDWVHKPTVLKGLGSGSRDESIARYWGLLEEETETIHHGRVGFWRVTFTGAAFVLGRHAIPKYAHIYNGECLRLSGPKVTVDYCLGKRFDRAALMADTGQRRAA